MEQEIIKNRPMIKEAHCYAYDDPLSSHDDESLQSFYRRILPFLLWADGSSGSFRVDVQDEGDSYPLQAELPGVSKENMIIR